MHGPALLESLLHGLPRISIQGPWSRAIGFHLLQGPPPGEPPLSAPQPLWPRGVARRGARFTPRGGFESVYLASDPVTALTEVLAVIQHRNAPPFTNPTIPWAIVAVNGALTNILDLTDKTVQHTLGTSRQELTGGWAYDQAQGLTPPTQLLGAAGYQNGSLLGFKYPSSKNAAGTCFVLFTDRFPANPSSFLEVYDPYGNLSQRLPQR